MSDGGADAVQPCGSQESSEWAAEGSGWVAKVNASGWGSVGQVGQRAASLSASSACTEPPASALRAALQVQEATGKPPDMHNNDRKLTHVVAAPEWLTAAAVLVARCSEGRAAQLLGIQAVGADPGVVLAYGQRPRQRLTLGFACGTEKAAELFGARLRRRRQAAAAGQAATRRTSEARQVAQLLLHNHATAARRPARGGGAREGCGRRSDEGWRAAWARTKLTRFRSCDPAHLQVKLAHRQPRQQHGHKCSGLGGLQVLCTLPTSC